MARRNILRANPGARVEAIVGNFLEADVAAKFTDCDYLFLAADTMRARLLFNAIVHQYLIPGVQVGAKVQVDELRARSPMSSALSGRCTPESGCLPVQWADQRRKASEKESISDRRERLNGMSMTLTLSRQASSH